MGIRCFSKCNARRFNPITYNNFDRIGTHALYADIMLSTTMA